MPRIVFFLSSFLVVGIIGFFVIQYAKGLRFNTKTFSFDETGILVSTSTPDGAQVLINGKLKAATNENLTLVPDTYDIEIIKEGYLPWRKRMTIKASEVSKTDAILFPKAPTLAPLTFDGAVRAFSTHDGTKLAWLVKANTQSQESIQLGNNGTNGNKTGLWIIELSNLPFGFAREARHITDADLTESTVLWSPDGRGILIQKGNSYFLIETNKFTRQESLVALSQTQGTKIISNWQAQEEKRVAAQIKKLPEDVQDMLQRKTKTFIFSPDETKVLYVTSGSATLTNNLITSVPGSSSQKQDREIKPNKTYVYDIKEDRNFLIDEDSSALSVSDGNPPAGEGNFSRRLTWFPTSRHLLLAEPNRITILEYDGINRAPIWSAPYEAPYAFATPDGGQLIILTNFGSTDGSSALNLYTINLK